ncbi:hypothetical protein LEP1GSC110_4499 [Leptospira interrogans serovar Medanensis str. UT053]|nr:hypothetical protein LEP1GSC110_4499 [Leptospira interrogans serovar Medanensis str. UT053]
MNVRWKGRQFRIPKSEIQRIDYSKKGPESSYNYSEFRLTDGSQVRGIIVELKRQISFSNRIRICRNRKI